MSAPKIKAALGGGNDVARWLVCLAIVSVVTGWCLTSIGGFFTVRGETSIARSV